MWVPHRKKKSRLIPRHSRKGLLGAHIEFSCTRVPRSRWQLEVQNCWALRHGQAFLYASLKQKPVHVHTEISSRPGSAATSMSLSSILSRHERLHGLLHLMRSYMTQVLKKKKKKKRKTQLLILRSTDWKASYTAHVSRRQMSFYFGGKAYGHPRLVKETQ